MLPGMAVRPIKKLRVALVGAGNLASALAPSLRKAGYRIEWIVSRQRPTSLQRARRLASEVGAKVRAITAADINADVVWFCVPDSAVGDAARSMMGVAEWERRVALLSSGALTSDELEVLRGRGAAVASVHPLMTFVRGSRPMLEGVAFAIEGDQKAVRVARAIVRDLHGHAFAIRKQDKAAYHAWGMFVSPLLTALLAAGENVASAAGIARKEARQRMLPILDQTLANYARLGAPGSFSGPIARGDLDTIRKHLKVLQSVPGAREVYIALARVALRELPAKNRDSLEQTIFAG